MTDVIQTAERQPQVALLYTTEYQLKDDIYPAIYHSLDKLNGIETISSEIALPLEDDEITHTVFFGENIKRVLKVLLKR